MKEEEMLDRDTTTDRRNWMEKRDTRIIGQLIVS